VEKLMADHGFSERRACRLIGVNRSAWQYEPKGDGDTAVRARLREIANERRRFGYRRLAILLRREGVRMNLKKVYRLYREERLTVRRRGGRKRALGTRAPMAVPQAANQRWSLDFVSDVLSDGRSTLEALVLSDRRARRLAELYLARHAAHRHRVLAAGEVFRLVFVGNHCKGAVFKDGRAHITAAMEAAFDRIACEIPEFHFGRFDVRFRRLEDLERGERFRRLCHVKTVESLEELVSAAIRRPP
jgi:hypothetical protein